LRPGAEVLDHHGMDLTSSHVTPSGPEQLPTDRLVRRCQHPDEYSDAELRAAFPDLDRTALGDVSCGIACVHMIVRSVLGSAPDYLRLIRAGFDAGAFTDQGWLHAGLADLLTELGVPARATGALGPEQLLAACARGLPSIVSCSIGFPEDGQRGGHLVVLLGELPPTTSPRVAFADPSRWGETHRDVESARFWASWSGRAIVLEGD
jgi:hypothetical protein